MRKHAIEKIPLQIIYVPDQYKTHKMCDKSVANYAHALEFIPDCHKTQETYNKDVNIYPFILQFAPEY